MAKKVRTPAEITAQLADLIEDGRKKVRKEFRYMYLVKYGRSSYCGCPLGMAYASFCGSAKTALRNLGKSCSMESENVLIQEQLGISIQLSDAVEKAHLDGSDVVTIIEQLRRGDFNKFVKK